MPDVCTLIVNSWMTLQACIAPITCAMSADGSKKLCIGGGAMSCPMPAATFECKRSDGSTYIWKDEK